MLILLMLLGPCVTAPVSYCYIYMFCIVLFCYCYPCVNYTRQFDLIKKIFSTVNHRILSVIKCRSLISLTYLFNPLLNQQGLEWCHYINVNVLVPTISCMSVCPLPFKSLWSLSDTIRISHSELYWQRASFHQYNTAGMQSGLKKRNSQVSWSTDLTVQINK